MPTKLVSLSKISFVTTKYSELNGKFTHRMIDSKFKRCYNKLTR